MLTLPQLVIEGREIAERALRNSSFTHLVSLRDLGTAPLMGAASAGDRIELSFSDVSGAAPFGYRPAEREDVRTLVDWLRERREELRTGHVLFQSERGVSRAPAAAIIALRVLGVSRRTAFEAVHRIRAGLHPNAEMIELSDGLLGQ
jgi:predicted protein tyrosine phosphatase